MKPDQTQSNQDSNQHSNMQLNPLHQNAHPNGSKLSELEFCLNECVVMLSTLLSFSGPLCLTLQNGADGGGDTQTIVQTNMS